MHFTFSCHPLIRSELHRLCLILDNYKSPLISRIRTPATAYRYAKIMTNVECGERKHGPPSIFFPFQNFYLFWSSFLFAGTFRKGMKVGHSRMKRTINLSSAQALFAQDRESITEAYPGDVIGTETFPSFCIGAPACIS